MRMHRIRRGGLIRWGYLLFLKRGDTTGQNQNMRTLGIMIPHQEILGEEDRKLQFFLIQRSHFTKKRYLMLRANIGMQWMKKELFTVSVIAMMEKPIGMAIIRRIVIFRCRPKLAKGLLL